MKQFVNNSDSKIAGPTHHMRPLYAALTSLVFVITTVFCITTVTLFPSSAVAATTPTLPTSAIPASAAIPVPAAILASTSTAPTLAIQTSNGPGTASPATAPQTNSDNIAADKVDSFATAYLQVLQLLSDREPELPAAETSAEAQKIQQSIEAEAVAIIKASGLAMPEYMEILGLASQDSAFRDKILGRMDEAIEE